MYSLKNDWVLDPFGGTGTSTLACITSERNSITSEIEPIFSKLAENSINSVSTDQLNIYPKNRIKKHEQLIEERRNDLSKNKLKYFNKYLNLPVMIFQETEIKFSIIERITRIKDNEFTVMYN